MPVAIEIRNRYHLPTAGKSRAGGRAEKNIVIEIPDCRLPRTGIVKEVIRMGVVVKIIRHSDGRTSQIITYDVEVDAFRRCGRYVGRLAGTSTHFAHTDVPGDTRCSANH